MDNKNYILVSYLNEFEYEDEEIAVYETIISDIEKILRDKNLKYVIAKEPVINKKLKDSISKDKIREKIEEIQKRMNDDCLVVHEIERIAKIDILKELLEE